MNNKKIRIAIISVVALLLVLIGVTYAYWLVTKEQTNSNIISSACLDITLDNESNDINLTSQYPMSDEEGMKLIPYTFTVTNNCNTSIDYEVALEAMGDEETSIASSALKVALNNNPIIYSSYKEVVPTIGGTYESRSIGYARLSASGNEGSSDIHSLRIWIDENAPISEANKTFQSKISVTIGQGIQNPYEEGTLAYNIIANNELNTDSIDFSVPATNTNRNIYKAQDDLGDSYYFRGAATNNYVHFAGIPAGDQIGTRIEYVLPYYYDYLCGEEWCEEGPFATSEVCEVAASINDGTCRSGEEWMDIEVPVYSTEEVPMYWRIVRINGDGTIRLIYDGIEKKENGTMHNASIGNVSYNSEDYTNINYGDSDIKGVVDTWYNTYLKINYESYIADGIFCNDKEIAYYNYYDEERASTTEANAEYSEAVYSPHNRLYSAALPPILACTRKEYRFTTNTNLGNGLLTHPVGLLTADEVNFAGGVLNGNNSDYYLTTGNYFWTSSPDQDNVFEGGYTYAFVVNDVGAISSLPLSDSEGSVIGVRPVINLRADVEFTGNGSFETPYVIVTE